MNDAKHTLLKTLGLGAIARLRSMAAPALLSQAAVRGTVTGLEGTPFGVLGSRKVSALLGAMALGEVIADKTPLVPSRTSPPALLGRMVVSALVGAALFAPDRRRAVVGGALGAVSTVVAAYTGEHLRALGSERLSVPDPLLGLLEDGLVLFFGTRLLRKDKTGQESDTSRV